MGSASNRVVCPFFGHRAPCPALAIARSERTRCTTIIAGTARHVSGRRWCGSGRRRRCARTFPGQFVRHRCRATRRLRLPVVAHGGAVQSSRRHQAHENELSLKENPVITGGPGVVSRMAGVSEATRAARACRQHRSGGAGRHCPRRTGRPGSQGFQGSPAPCPPSRVPRCRTRSGWRGMHAE